LPARILIADDSTVLRRTLRALLESYPDWQVCGEAETGEDAVKKTAELKPDLIILDFAMPEKDGLQATRDICSAYPQVPVLIYTDYAFSPDAKLEARKQGAREVINKGTSPDQLIDTVKALLAQPHQEAQGATASEQDLPAGQSESHPLPN
jgi:DNA-binding NarL/FixJ family response regulator